LLNTGILKLIYSFTLYNQILVNYISQICQHMTGDYSLGYYSAKHALNKQCTILVSTT